MNCVTYSNVYFLRDVFTTRTSTLRCNKFIVSELLDVYEARRIVYVIHEKESVENAILNSRIFDLNLQETIYINHGR